MRSTLATALLIALAGSSAAAVEGTVTTGTGTPIEHAKVEVSGGDAVVFSDRHGHFRLPADPPLSLRVTHPRFVEQLLDLQPGTTGPVEVQLRPKLEIYEKVTISANPGEEIFAPVSVAASNVSPDESTAPPSTLGELVVQLPSVSENGQGGIFQTYSIRGISRQRVMNLVSGMRIVSERRAGTSVSFIDPRLIGSVDVLRGPSSTYYGSGALGGVVQLFPRRFDGWSVEAGYAAIGDENYQLVGWGDEHWSVGAARRQADNGETPAGETLFSQFEQLSAVARYEWSAGSARYGVQLIHSDGDDIGKANTDFPDRVTSYPDESHTLLRFDMRSDNDWQLDLWVHDNSLETQVVDDESGGLLENEATDFGYDWQRLWSPADALTVRFGTDYFGRRGVRADEALVDFAMGTTVSQTTLDGEEDEAGLFGAVEWSRGKVVGLAGARAAFQRQNNVGFSRTDDSALTAFAGVVVGLREGLELVANAGTGLRFPSLSERYFSGRTGRGDVIGNPALDPESSVNVDVGLRRYGKRLFLTTYLFRNDIDEYIERIVVAGAATDVLTFRNLTSGTIQGIELDAYWRIDEAWNLTFGGHALEGEGEDGEDLADIPADRAFVGATWSRGRWTVDGRLERRLEKDDPGSGEKVIPSASIFSASVGYTFDETLGLSLFGLNLLDDEYFNSADDKVPLAAARSVGVSLRWTR